MSFFNLNIRIGFGLIEFGPSITLNTILSLLIVFMLLILYNFISKNQPTNIDIEDLDFPIYRDLDILLQEKPIHNNSQEFLPEIPLNTRVSIFTKIILILLSLSMIFFLFSDFIWQYSEFIHIYF